MSFRDPEWRHLQAGEYVLSTLADDELRKFEEVLRHDHDLQQIVIKWQERLQPLALTIEPVQPPERVWKSLSNELRFNDSRQRSRPKNESAGGHRRKKARQRRKKLRNWQLAASLSMAVSAVLFRGCSSTMGDRCLFV